MFGFFKRKLSDEEYSRMFVRRVLVLGAETCRSVAKVVEESTQGKVSFPIDVAGRTAMSMVILGTSLAILKGHSRVMTVDRGTQIETYCKRFIEKEIGLSSDTIRVMVDIVDEHQDAFLRSIPSKKNPFGEVSGMILRNAEPLEGLYVRDTKALDPLIQQVVGDLIMMTVTKALTFWKGK